MPMIHEMKSELLQEHEDLVPYFTIEQELLPISHYYDQANTKSTESFQNDPLDFVNDHQQHTSDSVSSTAKYKGFQESSRVHKPELKQKPMIVTSIRKLKSSQEWNSSVTELLQLLTDECLPASTRSNMGKLKNITPNMTTAIEDNVW